MIERLCTICARGGSKGFKNKNIAPLLGKPLIAHIIEVAKKTSLFYGIAISSDSADILAAAKEAGADFLIQRPDVLATDHAAKLPAIQHCANEVQKLTGKMFKTFVDLSVTSPLMLPKDIQGAVKLLEESEAFNVITAAVAKHSPYFSMVEPQESGYVQLVKNEGQFNRRQDVPICYGMNGAIYVWSGKTFFDLATVITDKTLVFEMPGERSVDVDTEFDFNIIKMLFSQRLEALTKENVS
jgi:CMP-N,N'-diacetyllegionaminic acid synthase